MRRYGSASGLLPILWGSGSAVMSRIAAPMLGGMIFSVVIPVIDALVKEKAIRC